MSRFSPTVTPEYYGPTNPGQDVAAAINGYIRQKRADEEYAYLKRRRDVTDPLEDALHRAELIRQGVIPPDGEAAAGAPGASAAAIDAQRGNRTQSNYGGGAPPASPPQRGNLTQAGYGGAALTTPGAFNPLTGDHNPAQVFGPEDRYYDLGGGFRMEDPTARRERFATEDERRLTAAGVPAGVAAYAARHPENSQAILSDFFTSRDTAYHPKTMAEALEYERQLAAIRARYKTPAERNDRVRLVGQQIDDARASLGAAERAQPKRPLIFATPADSLGFSRDSTNAADRVGALRSRVDSLEAVRDAEARGVPFDPDAPRPGESPRDYAARLKRTGRTRAQAADLFRRHRVPLQ